MFTSTLLTESQVCVYVFFTCIFDDDSMHDFNSNTPLTENNLIEMKMKTQKSEEFHYFRHNIFLSLYHTHRKSKTNIEKIIIEK